jgi:hypothetical protein
VYRRIRKLDGDAPIVMAKTVTMKTSSVANPNVWRLDRDGVKTPMKKLLVALLLLILAAPAFINVRFDHDWGDDFAMYILQAKKIALGSPLTDLEFLYDPVSASSAPPAYPVGFPLMLAPVYYIFGLSFRHFFYLMSAFAALLSLLTFVYLRDKTNSSASAYALAVSLAFNPWLIDFKNAVLSDLPFAVLTLLAVIAVERRKPVWAGLAMGLSLTTRPAAVALLVGLGANTVYRWVRQPSPEESRKTLLQQTAITLLVAIAVRVLLGAIFRTPSGSDTGYLNVIAPIAVLKELVPGNLNYYIDISKDFIPGFQWVFLSKLFWMSLVWCSLAGFLRKVRSGPQFSEFFVLPYLAMISAWPSWQGFRFLLPVVPMCLYYTFLELSQLGKSLLGPMTRYVPVTAVLLMWVAFAPFLIQLQRSHRQAKEGPMSPEAQEAYREIQRSTPSDAAFITYKPRALALFTGRKAAFDVPGLPPDAFGTFVKQKNIHYLLLDLASESVRNGEYKKQIPSEIISTSVWENARYAIVKLDWN